MNESTGVFGIPEDSHPLLWSVLSLMVCGKEFHSLGEDFTWNGFLLLFLNTMAIPIQGNFPLLYHLVS